MIFVFAAYLIFLPLLIGLYRYRSLDSALKYILLYAALGASTEVIADLYQLYWSQNTMPIGNVYLPLSVIPIGLFYVHLLRNYFSPILLTGIIVSFEVFCIINLLFIQNIYAFPNIPGALAALIVMFFSILLFHKIMLEAKIKRLFQEPIVWINIGVLLYSASSLFYYALFNYSLQISNDFVFQTIKVNSIALIIFYTTLTIGLWKAKKK